MSLVASGSPSIASSVEETALALEILSALPAKDQAGELDSVGCEETDSLIRGYRWLVESVETNRFRQPSPIGFYFAKLWYHEKLYPIIFTTSALGRAVQRWSGAAESSPSPKKSLLSSVTADSEPFPERSQSKRQLAPSGKDDTASAAPVIKQPCP